MQRGHQKVTVTMLELRKGLGQTAAQGLRIARWQQVSGQRGYLAARQRGLLTMLQEHQKEKPVQAVRNQKQMADLPAGQKNYLQSYIGMSRGVIPHITWRRTVMSYAGSTSSETSDIPPNAGLVLPNSDVCAVGCAPNREGCDAGCPNKDPPCAGVPNPDAVAPNADADAPKVPNVLVPAPNAPAPGEPKA